MLRAVNVGGTGKLQMTTLVQMCETIGFEKAKNYIASGNVVFGSDWPEDQVRSTLDDQLYAHAGKRVGVTVRTASEIADVYARNPFADASSNRVTVLFVNGSISADPLDGVTGITNEDVRLGKRELFVFYPDGMAKTRFRTPSDRHGTARNMNTVAKLAEMTGAFA